MSYGVKYRCEYSDILGSDWKWDILKSGYSSTITSLTASGVPQPIEWYGTDDVLDQNICGSKAALTVEAPSDFGLSELFTSNWLEYPVYIYKDSVIFWKGFIIPDNYTEPYDGLPYSITLQANDGIGLLKNYKFSDFGYTGRVSIAQIIHDCLELVSVTDFVEYVNIYEDTMDSGTGDSMLAQCEIDSDLYYSDNCYDALESILSSFKMAIKQDNALMRLYRAEEIKSSMYGRIFDSALAITSTSINPEQKIDRPGDTSYFADVNGGNRMKVPSVKKVTSNFDYGFKNSWIDSYEFTPDKFDGTTFSGWTSVGGCVSRLASYYSTGESDGMLIDSYNTSPNLTKYKENIFGIDAIATTDVLNFEVEYMFYNSGASATGVHFYVDIINGSNYLYLYDTEFCGWGDSTHHLDLTGNAPTGNSGWTTLQRKVNQLIYDGPLTIRVYGLWSTISNIKPIIKNIRFYSTSDTVERRRIDRWDQWLTAVKWYYGGGQWKNFFGIPKKLTDTTIYNEEHIATNSSVIGKDKTIETKLGDVVNPSLDNILEQFSGALSIVEYDTLNNAVAAFDTDHSADYSPIDVTHSTSHIYFEAGTAGVDFTGSTTITNTYGNLTGSVSTLVPNAISRPQIDSVYILPATNGSITVAVNGYGGAGTKTCNWNTDVATTVAGFVIPANISYYASRGIILALNDGVPADGFTLTGDTSGAAYTFTTTITLVSGDMTWTLSTDQTASDAQKRKDHIACSGSWGDANITCNGVTKGISITPSRRASTVWSSRGGSESQKIHTLICDQVANQYSRQKQCIDMIIRETDKDHTLSVISNLQDSLNKTSGNNNIFAISRATFDTRDRVWELTATEIL